MPNIARRLKIADDVNTDYVISGRYKFHIQNPRELAKHVFEDIDESFCKRVKKGDFLVAGENFGCGSSREQAPLALKTLGLKAVVAKSFARIFYRNAFNIGLPLLECNTNYIDDEDELEFEAEKNILKNKSKGVFIDVKPLAPLLKNFLGEGGVIEYFKKHRSLKIEA